MKSKQEERRGGSGCETRERSLVVADTMPCRQKQPLLRVPFIASRQTSIYFRNGRQDGSMLAQSGLVEFTVFEIRIGYAKAQTAPPPAFGVLGL